MAKDTADAAALAGKFRAGDRATFRSRLRAALQALPAAPLSIPSVEELKDAGVDYQLVSCSGAVHAFTQPMAANDPSRGAA